MKLVISADHAGFSLKEEVRAYLTKAGHEMLDLGAYNGNTPDDYPDFAEKVREAINPGVAKRGSHLQVRVGVCVAVTDSGIAPECP
jgi:ribose 5-phosphate isomerase B